jgi:hypothetical protein
MFLRFKSVSNEKFWHFRGIHIYYMYILYIYAAWNLFWRLISWVNFRDFWKISTKNHPSHGVCLPSEGVRRRFILHRDDF